MGTGSEDGVAKAAREVLKTGKMKWRKSCDCKGSAYKVSSHLLPPGFLPKSDSFKFHSYVVFVYCAACGAGTLYDAAVLFGDDKKYDKLMDNLNP